VTKKKPELLIGDLEAIALGLTRKANAAEAVLGSSRLVVSLRSDIDWLERVIAKAKGN
jgi:hypothetical protein